MNASLFPPKNGSDTGGTIDAARVYRPAPLFLYDMLTPMATITIPRELAKKGDLVVISRNEYESLKSRVISEYTPTLAERRALIRARNRMRKNRAAGKLLTIDELKRKLARLH